MLLNDFNSVTKDMMLNAYKDRIGTTFGTYVVENVKYDDVLEEAVWSVKCVKCGYTVDVSHSIGRDWMRGKGRNQEKCPNCKKIEKAESEKLKKIKKESEARARELKAVEKARRRAERDASLPHYEDPKWIGQKFGHLTILGYSNGDFVVRCDCGKEKEVTATNAAKGKVKSCGNPKCSYHRQYALDAGKYGEYNRAKGHEFEEKYCKYMQDRGYTVEKTKSTGDFGVDLIVTRKSDGGRTAVQLKCNGRKTQACVDAVQAVYAGGVYYDCDKFVVICTSGYTSNAKKLAEKLGVYLMNSDLDKELEPCYDKNVYYTIDGVEKSQTEWCKEYGISKNLFHIRMKQGMTPKEALETPKKNLVVTDMDGNKVDYRRRCKELGVEGQMVYARLKKGWTLEDALSTPKLTVGRPRKTNLVQNEQLSLSF